jgi:hypothetical protein
VTIEQDFANLTRYLGEWGEPKYRVVLSRIEEDNKKREQEYTEAVRYGAALKAQRDAFKAALSRYADHDRVCDSRENSLYACTCGFVSMIERFFPPVAEKKGWRK